MPVKYSEVIDEIKKVQNQTRIDSSLLSDAIGKMVLYTSQVKRNGFLSLIVTCVNLGVIILSSLFVILK